MKSKMKVKGKQRPGTQGYSMYDFNLSDISSIYPDNSVYCENSPSSVLLQHCADANIRNTDGKTALDLADPSAKAVLTGM